MYTQTKTAWHAQQELARALKAPHYIEDFSTINEKLGIESGTPVPLNGVLDLTYLAIGRGGHNNVAGVNGESLVDILQHKVTDGCLFEHLPFIIREISNDLSDSERAKYRLRRLETWGGKSYFAYYLRKLDLTTASPVIKKLVVENGNTTESTFTPLASQLNPTPVTIGSNGLPITVTNTHLAINAPITLTLDAADIKEITDACRIIYGDIRYSNITELAVCTGADRSSTSTSGGITVTYTEAVAVQPASFLGADVNLAYTTDEIQFRYKLGTTLRLLS